MANNIETGITLSGLKPSGYTYDYDSDKVKGIVYDYLDSRGASNDVKGIELKVKSEGNISPKLSLYLFIDEKSKYIKSGFSNIPKYLEDRLGVENVYLSDEFRNILLPICGNNLNYGRISGYVYVELNVFRVLGLDMMAEYGKHRVVIIDVKRTRDNSKEDCLIRATRIEGYKTKSNNNSGRYSNLVDRIESRSRRD